MTDKKLKTALMTGRITTVYDTKMNLITLLKKVIAQGHLNLLCFSDDSGLAEKASIIGKFPQGDILE